MSTSLMHQQQQQQKQDDLRSMMPSLMRSSYDHRHSSSISNDDYSLVRSHLDPSNGMLSNVPARPPQYQSTHHYNDQDQYPSYEEFDAIVQVYLQNLSSKKRDKALIDQARYAMILQVLKDPRNTTVSTAQFRFWVKKMFRLTFSSGQRVYHDGKPVAMREEIYGILVRAHREAHHGGRDKTSALVRRRFSWIPKELIARFVRHCPFCISRRNGSQQNPLSLGIFLPATPPTYTMVSEDSRQRAPSMIASSSSASSNASYPEEIMLMATATAHHQHQQESQQRHSSLSSFDPGAPIDLSWQSSSSSPVQQQPNYYATAAAGSATETQPNSFFDNQVHTSANSNMHYYSPSSTRQSYNTMTYPPSSSSIVTSDLEAHQPMTLQPALSVYYASDYGLKQNTTGCYSLVDSHNNMTFVPPSRSNCNSNILAHPSFTTVTNTNGNGNGNGGGVIPSPALSPSSSSTSATSSPVHPAYHETAAASAAPATTSHEHGYIQQSQQQALLPPVNASTNALNLLSHHQSLY